MKCFFCGEEVVAPFNFGEGIMEGVEGIKYLCQNHFQNFSNYAKSKKKN